MLGRMNIYRNKGFAKAIAERTGGKLVDDRFEDEFGFYWVVIWEDRT